MSYNQLDFLLIIYLNLQSGVA